MASYTKAFDVALVGFHDRGGLNRWGIKFWGI